MRSEFCTRAFLGHNLVLHNSPAFDVVPTNFAGSPSPQEDNCVIIVQEFCAGGDLLKIMYKCGGRLFERQAVNLVLQPFLTSLQYLHTQVRQHTLAKQGRVL